MNRHHSVFTFTVRLEVAGIAASFPGSGELTRTGRMVPKEVEYVIIATSTAIAEAHLRDRFPTAGIIPHGSKKIDAVIETHTY